MKHHRRILTASTQGMSQSETLADGYDSEYLSYMNGALSRWERQDQRNIINDTYG